jgi:hypothetical protein
MPTVCTPFGGSADFCSGAADGAAAAPFLGRAVLHLEGAATAGAAGAAAAVPAVPAVTADEYRRGPFLLHAAPPPGGGGAAVVRCYDEAAQRHFISADPACRGAGKPEAILGYASARRDTDTPRSLRVCASSSPPFSYHSLDAPCDAADTLVEAIGYCH